MKSGPAPRRRIVSASSYQKSSCPIADLMPTGRPVASAMRSMKSIIASTVMTRAAALARVLEAARELCALVERRDGVASQRPEAHRGDVDDRRRGVGLPSSVRESHDLRARDPRVRVVLAPEVGLLAATEN